MRSDLEQRLRELADLEQGWLDPHKNQGDPITSETIEMVRWLVPIIEQRDNAFVFIYPTEDGGICLEWVTGNVQHSLELFQVDYVR